MSTILEIGGGFKFHCSAKLEAKGGKPTLKKKSIRKIIELKVLNCKIF